MFVRSLITFVLVAATSGNGAELLLVATPPGPYLGGEAVRVDVFLTVDDVANHTLPFARLDFAASDPAVVLDAQFAFDLTSLADPGLYAVFPELPTPALVYTDPIEFAGQILEVPAGGMLLLGSIDLTLPASPGSYVVDALNSNASNPNLGARLDLGFCPAEPKRAQLGEIVGGTASLIVVAGCENDIECDDGNACTADSCDPATGCENSDISASCDDGDACTQDSCDPAVGCVNTDISATCDDNDACTADSCDPATGCSNTPDCQTDADCNGGIACTEDVCVGGCCGTQPVDCDDGNACTDDICDPVDGCQHTPVADDTACADATVCNGDETCQGGTCTAGTGLNCDDGNLCTDDGCDATLGCQNVNDDTNSCGDGLFCNGAETCASGVCQPGTTPCDDDVACTDDSCDEGTGTCTNTPNDAHCPDDGAFCNGTEFCDAGLDCSSTGNPCGVQVCDEGTDTCADCFVDADCDDDDVCTTDTCDAVDGCVNDPIAECCGNGMCEVGEDCTTCPSDCFSTNTGSCGDGICAGAAEGEDCFECAADCRCAGGQSCNACCGNGVCDGNGESASNCPVDCDPGFVLPTGSCCGDGTCEGSEGGSNCPIDCDIPCSIDADCDDGDLCNGLEACPAGACQSGTAPNCDDSEVCTTDTCDPVTGCVNDGTAVTIDCDDGDPQTLDDRCQGDAAGTCAGSLRPASLLDDPAGINRNRFLSFIVPSGATTAAVGETAIQIELTALNHICAANTWNPFEPCAVDADCPCPELPIPNSDCINGTCETAFGASEGQLRYLNVVRTCQGAATSTGEVICRSPDDCAIEEECLQFRTCDGTADLCASDAKCAMGASCVASMSCPDEVFKPPFLCATTGCTPEYRDWASDLAGGVLHVYGPGIVPARSEYNVRQIPAACAGSEASCAFASDALMITTARWADLTADGTTNAQDIAAASDKVKPIPEAFTKVRTMLIPGILDPFRNVNVLELQNTIDAVKSLPMTGLITGPEDCGG